MKDPKINILFLLTSLRRCGPVLGGVALAKSLDPSIYAVTVASLSGEPGGVNNRLLDDLRNNGIGVQLLDMPGWAGLVKMAILRRWVRARRFDMVNSIGLRPDILAAALDPGPVRISWIRGIIESEYRSRIGRIAGIVFSKLHFRVLGRMDRVVAMFPGMREHLIRGGVPGERIVCIPNMVDLTDMPKPLQAGTVNENRTIRVGFIGGFHARKRVDWIVRAVNKVSTQLPHIPIQLHLLGDGPLLEPVADLVATLGMKDRVTFYGYTEDAYAHIRAMDIVVLASSSEGTPRVFMEAMAMGRTCLGPRIDGVEALIKPGETGYLFDPDDPNDLTDQLLGIIRGKRYLPPAVISEHIYANFATQAVSEKVSKLFQNVGVRSSNAEADDSHHQTAYGGFERRVAAYLSRYPDTKRKIKSLYRSVNYHLHAHLLGKQTPNSTAIRIVPDRFSGSRFFGYYGKCQINKHGKALVCASNLKRKRPEPGDRLQLLCGTLGAGDFQAFAETTSWNWQQGCMLEWLTGSDEDLVIFNDFRNGKFAGIVHNVSKGEEKILSGPVAAVSGRHRFALGLNFSRLHHLSPAYGYPNDAGYLLDSKAPSDDGIWTIDLITGKSRLLVSIETLAGFRREPTMEDAWHKVNHIEIAPDGKCFMFLHRWIIGGRKYTRLMAADAEGQGLRSLSNGGMVSHCAWKDRHRILAWIRTAKGLHRYCLVDIRTAAFEYFGEGHLTEDGHPSFSPCGRFLLTDSYPDRVRMRSLILYDQQDASICYRGRFFAPLAFDGDLRCDLHPRWSEDGRYISFDSCHEGLRNSYFIDTQERDFHAFNG